jgi:hypothetical protein
VLISVLFAVLASSIDHVTLSVNKLSLLEPSERIVIYYDTAKLALKVKKNAGYWWQSKGESSENSPKALH